MAGMRGLGRVTNVLTQCTPFVSVAGGTIIANMKECSGIELICYNYTNALGGTLTVNAGTTAASARGTAYTTANGFGQPAKFYTQNAGTLATSYSGTQSWAAQTATWVTGSNSVTLGGAGTLSVIDFLCSELADQFDYLAFSSPNNSLQLTAVQYDLTVQRTPPNLSNPAT